MNRPSAAPESPTCAMYSVLPFKITTVAVVPDVLGSPCLVRGQESTNKKSYKQLNGETLSAFDEKKNLREERTSIASQTLFSEKRLRDESL